MSVPERAVWQSRLPFFYGWIVVGLAFTSAFFGIGMTWAAGLLAVPMHAELGWSLSAIFFAASLRGWMGIVITPLTGSYLDSRNGPRSLALVGGVLNSATLVLVGFMHAEWQFVLLFGVLGGVAQAVTSGISVAVVPKWFVRSRGSAVSLSSLGGGLAAFVMPPLVAVMSGAAGWRGAWMLLGALAFATATLPALLLARQPEDLGLLPDGGMDRRRSRQHRAKASLQSLENAQARVTAPAFTLRAAIGTSTFWVLTIAVSVGSLASNGIPANAAAIFVDRGFSLRAAAAALMWYGAASVGAKVVWGWIANRVQLRTVLLVLTLYGALALPSILLVRSGAGAWSLGYGFLVGFFVGAFIPLSQLVWAEYFGRAHLGAISAIGRPLSIATLAGGPFLLAFTRDLSGSYSLGIAINAVAVAVCFLCIYLVRAPRPPVIADEPAVSVQPAL